MSEGHAELSEIIRERGANRTALVICEEELRLDSRNDRNNIYVIELQHSGGAAGGRVGGFGQRTVTRIMRFAQEDGSLRKDLMVSDPSVLSGFDPPYQASAIQVTLGDGSRITVSGLVDKLLIAEYDRKFRPAGVTPPP